MSYMSEKFNTARSYLMLPHEKGEAYSIMTAFHECNLGLMGYEGAGLEEDDKADLDKLLAFMNTDGIADDPVKGKWLVKAEGFCFEEKSEISRIIESLCYAFARKS